MPVDVQATLRRYRDMLAQRATWDTTLQEIAEFVVPHKANITRSNTPGQKQTERLFDGTAIHASRLLAASLHGTLTPSSQPWLSLKMRQDELNDDKSVNDWLEDDARRMHRALRQSTFSSQVHEMYLDLVAFGTGCLYCEEKEPGRSGQFAGLRFRSIAWGEYTISEDSEGVVDTVFRVLTMPARAQVAKWAKSSDRVKKLAETKPDQLVAILHAVYPRKDREYGRRDGVNMPWASCYIEMEEIAGMGPQGGVSRGKLLDEGGFEEFPFMVPRWEKTAGELYGRGPSHVAGPDARTLNAFTEFTLKAIPLAIQPPTLERDDSVLGDLDLTPGGRNVVSGAGAVSDLLQFLRTEYKPDLANDFFQRMDRKIKEAYHTSELQLPDKTNMTATEIQVHWEIMQRILGPTLGRLESEFLNPLVERVFGLMARARAFVAMPRALAPQPGAEMPDLDVEYEGPMARAQRTIELTAQDRIIGFATAVSNFWPAIWDVLDLDKMLRNRAEITGLPSDNLRAEDDVEQTRQDRAAQQAQQAQLAAGATIAEAAGKAAPMVKTLGELGAPALSGRNGGA